MSGLSARLLRAVFGADSKFSQEPLALGGALVHLLIWSSWYVVSRWGVTGSMTPADIILVRYITAALITWPFFLTWRKLDVRLPWKVVIVLVLSNGLIYLLSLFYGLQHTPVANAGVLLNGLLPVANGLLAWLIYRKKVSGGKWGSMLLLAAANGCMLVAGIQNASLSWGWAMVLVAMVSVGIYMTVYRQNPLDYRVIIPVITFGNLLLFLPFYPFMESNLAQAETHEIIIQAVFQGVINQIMVIYLIGYTVSRLGSVSTSVIYGFVPAMAALLGWMFLGETIVALELVGIIGCTIGIIMFARAR